MPDFGGAPANAMLLGQNARPLMFNDMREAREVYERRTQRTSYVSPQQPPKANTGKPNKTAKQAANIATTNNLTPLNP
jgi:hypothetical protein